MDAEQRIAINVERMFPEAARRVRVLEAMQRSWAEIVSAPIARCSWPYNLGVNKLCVACTRKAAEGKLRAMKATIVRRVKKVLDYEFEGDFELEVTERE